MIGKIISLAVLAVGAILCYGAKPFIKKVLKKEADDKSVAQVKLSGFLVAVVGVVLLFIIGGVSL